MTIDKIVAETISKHKLGKQRNKKIKAKLEKYNQLIEKGYIKKQLYSISRLDTIGYSLYNCKHSAY